MRMHYNLLIMYYIYIMYKYVHVLGGCEQKRSTERQEKYLIDKIQYDKLDNAFFTADLQCAVDLISLKVLHRDVHPSEKARAKSASSNSFGIWLSTAVKLRLRHCPFLHLIKAFIK